MLTLNGNPIPSTANVRAKLSSGYFNCTVPGGQQSLIVCGGILASKCDPGRNGIRYCSILTSHFMARNSVRGKLASLRSGVSGPQPRYTIDCGHLFAGESSLLLCSADNTVSVFAVAFSNMTLDLSSTNASIFNVSAPLSPDISPLPTRAFISDFAFFSERVLRNPPLDAQPTGAPTVVQPASVWLAIAVWDSGSTSSDSRILILRLPQFSDQIGWANDSLPVFPPASPPAVLNPAGISTAGQLAACGWNLYWNGSACQWLPIDQPYTESNSVFSVVEVWLSCACAGPLHFSLPSAFYCSRGGAPCPLISLPNLFRLGVLRGILRV